MSDAVALPSTVSPTIIPAPPRGIWGNPYFIAGFGLAGVGTGIAVLRKGAGLGYALLKRRLLASIEVTSKDPGYPWVLQWVRSHAKNSQHLSLETTFNTVSGRTETSFSFVPSVGAHVVKYKGTWIRVDRAREKEVIDLSSGSPWEAVTLTTLGRDKRIFVSILEEARGLAQQREEGKTIVYTAWGTEWRPFGQPRRRRPLHSVILDDGVMQRLVSDVKDFIANAPWYIDRGIPHRRGYLLYGPPGTGKTSFVTALAGEIEYNICILNVHDKGLTDDRLLHLMAVVPPRSIILLEDIDACAPAPTPHLATAQRPHSAPVTVTYTGLLNTLDGAASTEQRLVFMTTNHVERLEAVLIRPGRVDVMQELGLASAHQIRHMFLRFFPNEHALAEQFVRSLTAASVSTAALQGFLMLHRTSASSAVLHAHHLAPPQHATAAHSSHAA